MKKLVIKDLIYLQKKLEMLDTEEYNKCFSEDILEIFRQDIINTMGLTLKIILYRS